LLAVAGSFVLEVVPAGVVAASLVRSRAQQRVVSRQIDMPATILGCHGTHAWRQAKVGLLKHILHILPAFFSAHLL
jgi:hypothetical protein